MEDLAAFFNSLPNPVLETDPSARGAGEKLYRGGDGQRGRCGCTGITSGQRCGSGGEHGGARVARGSEQGARDRPGHPRRWTRQDG